MAAIVSIVFGVIELLVGFRFFFLLFGANPEAPFVAWVYQLSTPLITPFAGILGQPTTVPATTVVQSVFEPSTLIALVVYGAIGGLLLRVFSSQPRV